MTTNVENLNDGKPQNWRLIVDDRDNQRQHVFYFDSESEARHVEDGWLKWSVIRQSPRQNVEAQAL